MCDCEEKRREIEFLTIIGQVEGHYLLPENQKTTKYEHMIPTLCDIECDDTVKGVIFLLNTIGGDVEAGLALAELITGLSKPTATVVLGGGHSIGVPLAVCGTRSFIVPSATMTLHPVRISGTLIGAPQTYYYFEQMQNRISKFICDHSNCSPDMLNSLMLRTDELATDVGSIIDGESAVKYGLIDQIGGLSDAIDFIHRC